MSEVLFQGKIESAFIFPFAFTEEEVLACYKLSPRILEHLMNKENNNVSDHKRDGAQGGG